MANIRTAVSSSTTLATIRAFLAEERGEIRLEDMIGVGLILGGGLAALCLFGFKAKHTIQTLLTAAGGF